MTIDPTALRSSAGRVRAMQESASMAVAELARRLKLQGRSIINLAVGEPDFDTPGFIKLAAIEAMMAGKTKYTNVDGTADLKQAIADKLLRENGLSYTQNQIIASSGAKQSVFNALFAVLEPGDEVIIPAPYWVSYPEMATFAGGRPVCISAGAQSGFKLTVDALRASLTPASRMLILNSPNNPSGAIYTRKQLEALGEVIASHPRLLVLSDDIYEHIRWSQESFCNLAMARPDLMDRVLVVNGVSKAFAMTGWRIGYAAGPDWLIGAMRKIQSQSTTSANSIAQHAAATAINAGPAVSAPMIQAFRKRHELLVNGLNRIAGINCPPADGTFYAFPDVSGVLQASGLGSDSDLAEHWLRTAGIAVVPGTAYGMPGHVRFSFAASEAELTEALLRLKRAADEPTTTKPAQPQGTT